LDGGAWEIGFLADEDVGGEWEGHGVAGLAVYGYLVIEGYIIR
jgi:hypothetical protein